MLYYVIYSIILIFQKTTIAGPLSPCVNQGSITSGLDMFFLGSIFFFFFFFGFIENHLK